MKNKAIFMGATMAALVLAVMGRGVLAAPANANFEDDSFYNCVVTAYNSSTNSALTSSVSLSDTQLSQVKAFDGCPTQSGVGTTAIYPEFTNLSGLETLENMTSFVVNTSGVKSINLTNSENLTSAVILSDDVTSVDVTGLEKLSTLYVAGATVEADLTATANNGTYEIDLSGLKFLVGAAVSVNVGELVEAPTGGYVYTTTNLAALNGVLPIAVTTTVQGATQTFSYSLAVPTQAEVAYMPETSADLTTDTAATPDTGYFPVEINAVAAGIVGTLFVAMTGWFAWHKITAPKKIGFKG